MTTVDKLRVSVLIVYTIIFLLCFVSMGIALYYLSALPLDTFETSGVFIGILCVSLVLLTHSVWGCHRAKDVKNLTSKRKLARGVFFISSALLLGGFIAFTVQTQRVYNTIVSIEDKPLGYWVSHRDSPEEIMLYNFAVEFDTMWLAGGCSGNACVSADCSGDPVDLTPLTCDDRSMEVQFEDWSSHYTGTADSLRTCIAFMTERMGIPDFPSPTWCESRLYLLDSCKNVNLLISYVTMVLCILIILATPLVLMHMRLLYRLIKNDQLTGVDWLIYRSQFNQSGWFSEDESHTQTPPIARKPTIAPI